MGVRERILSVVVVISIMVSELSGLSPAYADDTLGINKAPTKTVPIVANVSPIVFNVTVPLCLPVNIDAYGNVTVATNAKIVNNASYGMIQINNLEALAQNNWIIINYDNSMDNEKVNTNKISMILNNCKTNNTGKFDFNASNFEVISYIDGHNSLPLIYNAKVPVHSKGLAGVTPMNVIFTVSWYGDTKEDNNVGPVPSNVTDYYYFVDDDTTNGAYRVYLTSSFKNALNANNGDGVQYKDWIPGNPLPNPGRAYGDKTITSFQGTFQDCSANKLDISRFDMEHVTNTCSMFEGCKASEINLKYLNTHDLVAMGCMFESCHNLKTIDLSSFNTPILGNMDGAFADCTSIETIDITPLNTNRVEFARALFQDCHNLKTINMSNFNTSKVRDMSYMFYQCKNLQSLDLSKFNTMTVGDMRDMFNGCESLQSLDLGSFNTSKVVEMQRMFADCIGLKSLNVSSFDTSNISYFDNMFELCKGLSYLDIHSFNTSKANSMQYMFSGCNNLQSLDLSSFDTSNLRNVQTCDGMFLGVNKTNTVYVRTQADANMFNASQYKPINLKFVVK